MKAKLKIVVVLMVLFMAACSTVEPSWKRSGTSAFDSDNTLAKCRYDIGLAHVSQSEKNEMLSNCMNAQGFRYGY